ncbi:hypothetical protein [Salinarimonas sp.]|uniref:hypothetical protein n=1 Tax=Salinarimonas sp. TaxID=2766526 RepID=UPI0032D8FE68
MTDAFRAGDPDAFEIAIRWIADPDPVRDRPAGYGWSMGELSLTVAGRPVTAATTPSGSAPAVRWYLAPVLGWLADEWESLLGEEAYPWPEAAETPAALACGRALDRLLGAEDAADRALFAQAHDWYARHGLRNAAAGGIFPDLFMRRFRDAVEISWSGEPAFFAPDGLDIGGQPGCVRLAPEEVGAPMRQALRWAIENPPADAALFPDGWTAFRRSLARVAEASPARHARSGAHAPP